jgi:hypothetical protein
MAQRKSTPSASKKPGSPSQPPAARKPGAVAKAAPTRPGARPPVKAPARPPVKKKPGRSIVNQKQTPWGLIITTVVIVVFAAGIVTYAVLGHKGSGGDSKNPYTQPEIAAAKQINGVSYKPEPDHTHVDSAVKYDTAPPIGGDHSQIWADCTGSVYPNAIANENAVHMLEHGAVWITYKPGLPAAQVTTLTKLVNGVDRMAMSPYPGLKTNISLQAWNYQLFVNSAKDKRIDQFIEALRANPKTTPENASCTGSGFKASQSYPGHPYNG